MTEEDIEEELSRNFVQLVASRGGFTYSQRNKDYGIDLQIVEVQPSARPMPSGRRFVETGRALDLQLKCTCQRTVAVTDAGLRYALRAKNYNDLVDRWRERPNTPMYLVLFVLP